MKKLLVCVLFSLTVIGQHIYCGEFRPSRGNSSLKVSSSGQAFGSGRTRAEAYTNALRRVPAGAIQVGCFFNGWSSGRADGSDYSGSFSCRVAWKRYSGM
jgi:hypothetical protein